MTVPIPWRPLQITADQARRDYPHLWATALGQFAYLDDIELAKIVSLAIDVCGDCYNAPAGCRCGNDE